MTTSRIVKPVALAAVAVLLALVPYTWFPGFGLLPDYTGAAGSLSLLSKVMIMAALAVTFDLLLGQSGLMSFGHVLYFGVGAYAFAMLLAYTSLTFWVAAALTVLLTAGLSLLLSLVALRVENIAYSMVTLAFAQVGAVAVARNYFGTGGESGLRLPTEKIPALFVGLQNTPNVYWFSLATLAVVVTAAALVVRSRFGLSLRGTRDNALRMRVLGYNVYGLRLAVSVVASTLAGLCGVAYVVTIGGTDPDAVGLMLALSLIFMVVIGGSGSLVGAAIGGTVYAFLDMRLPAVGDGLDAGSVPPLVAHLLGEPDLLLGVIFLIVVFVAPKGIVGIAEAAVAKVRARRAGPLRVVLEEDFR
ncbi:branched-chain amino acid ABC transporter permease [Acrocarpospora catenulata]|uniref:branched-chain amino acid ABC transporter permease n=1 Tax=Acrocarpospora catenulata TaxID=2836182 RepID=UPI001BD968E8|nr:branched-chain amino acid ABC transporter permease [Acrocarpospora catenulata]